MKRDKRVKNFVRTIIIISILFSIINIFSGKKVQAFLGNDTETTIPVLMYHSISDKGNGIFVVKKNAFRNQMKYLKENNFNTLTVSEVYDLWKNNKPIPQKSIVVTFDDGYRDNYTNAYPILKEFDIKASIFIVTNKVDKNSYYMNSNELKEIHRNGIDIQSHTVNHDNLKTLSYKEQYNTLKESKEYLQDTLNKKVDFLAYPYGKYNDDTLKAIKEIGYKMAFTTHVGYGNKEKGIYEIRRIVVPNHIPLPVFTWMCNK